VALQHLITPGLAGLIASWPSTVASLKWQMSVFRFSREGAAEVRRVKERRAMAVNFIVDVGFGEIGDAEELSRLMIREALKGGNIGGFYGFGYRLICQVESVNVPGLGKKKLGKEFRRAFSIS
jgi:hypothetical protein